MHMLAISIREINLVRIHLAENMFLISNTKKKMGHFRLKSLEMGTRIGKTSF